MNVCSSAPEAISKIKNGDKVFIQGACATPHILIEALVEALPNLLNLEIFHLHTHGKARYAESRFKENARVTSLFLGSNLRAFMDCEHVDYLPCFLSEIPKLLREGPRRPNVALIQVSPPDAHGFCTLGTSVDVAASAVSAADLVIAQINKQMPKVHGDGFIHVDQIDYGIDVDRPLDELKSNPPGKIELEIGRQCAELIEDGSCLQTGIGDIPNAVLASLGGHKNLGVHTEMWSDGVLDLIEKGVINNSNKKVHQHKTVSTFIMGTKRVFDYIHDNPSVLQVGADYINNPNIIKRNPKTVAINCAVEVDLTGQVCADSIGPRIISGVGGQMDFIRGASLSEGGKPVIAMASRTKKGESKIVTCLRKGAGVVTTRNHVHYVVTEYGAVNLYGKTLHERSEALISIAHPDDRERLSKEWRDIHRC